MNFPTKTQSIPFGASTTVQGDCTTFPRFEAIAHLIHQDPVLSQVKLIAEPLNGLASRFAGSIDLHEDDGRRPPASIDVITAHTPTLLRRS